MGGGGGMQDDTKQNISLPPLLSIFVRVIPSEKKVFTAKSACHTYHYMQCYMKERKMRAP